MKGVTEFRASPRCADLVHLAAISHCLERFLMGRRTSPVPAPSATESAVGKVRVRTPDELGAEGKSQPNVKAYRNCPVCGQFGSTAGYQTGAIPDLPYRIVRPESKLPKTRDMPNPPRAVILDWLRPY
jgi:hypothetical protein